MPDIGLIYENNRIRLEAPKHALHLSKGVIQNVFPENHLKNEVPTPGPCFELNAKLPGRMSGSPIFGADGAVVRGVVSRSSSGERHGYGAMLGPSMHLPLNGDETTIAKLMRAKSEGIPEVIGQGL